MNLGDPELEFIDPTPNVHTLFLHFDQLFFWTKLASRVVVRWSKKMYSSAGVCSYEGRDGLCDIALSEPLLKLRPRKDLIETLLHEMIHAYLFITCRVQDRDGHGPNFKEHMYRINKSAGVNISIYHDFHEEVKLYQTHWWRCNGPCQTRKPYFGIVRRSQNNAPGPKDYWWSNHLKTCGGAFVKFKEPEQKIKKPKKPTEKTNIKNVDITKYVRNSKAATDNKQTDEIRKPLTPIVKNVTNASGNKVKSNSTNTVVVTKKGVTSSPVIKPPNSQSPILFSVKGQVINGSKNRTNSVDAAEAVRNIWANKQLPGVTSNKPNILKRKTIAGDNHIESNTTINKPNNLESDQVEAGSPPSKKKKIDDYFNKAATSIIKDVYGEDFRLTQTNNKLVAAKVDLVDCPVCRAKVDSSKINRHLDECLNKDVIEKLSKDNVPLIGNQSSRSNQAGDNVEYAVTALPTIPINKSYISNIDRIFKEKNGDVKPVLCVQNIIDLTNIRMPNMRDDSAGDGNRFDNPGTSFDSNDVNKVREIVKKIKYNKHVEKTGNLAVKEEPKNPDCGFLPSFLDDIGCAIKAPSIKIEPGTSKDIVSILTNKKCPCCDEKIDKPMAEHLDECLAFFDNNTIVPEEGASTSFANNTIVIDDDEDDIFDETLTLNATGTKTPCPCCLEMIESVDMNNHLDRCLS